MGSSRVQILSLTETKRPSTLERTCPASVSESGLVWVAGGSLPCSLRRSASLTRSSHGPELRKGVIKALRAVWALWLASNLSASRKRDIPASSSPWVVVVQVLWSPLRLSRLQILRLPTSTLANHQSHNYNQQQQQDNYREYVYAGYAGLIQLQLAATD